jgi:hypothetical protein
LQDILLNTQDGDQRRLKHKVQSIIKISGRDPTRIKSIDWFGTTSATTATMTIYTTTCSCTFLPLLCALLSTSVFARLHSSRTVFVPRKNPTTVSSSLSPASPPFSALDTSAFSSERDAQILAARVSSFVIAANLCRGGYQDYDNYDDDRGYNGNNDDYYSKPYADDGNYNYDDNHPYDDRGPSVRIFHDTIEKCYLIETYPVKTFIDERLLIN